MSRGIWRLRFDQDADHSLYQFELLRSTSVQQGLDPLSNISVVLFSFERQKNSWGKAQSFGHGHDRVKARNLLSTFNISPKIRGYVGAFRGLL